MVNNFTPKVEMMATVQLQEAPFNPKNRTEKRNLTGLIEDIRRLGGIVQPLIVSRDNKVIDGHRRLAAAKVLALDVVPVIVVSFGLQDGWTAMNNSSMPIQSKDWVYLHAQGVQIEFIKPKFAGKIQEIEAMVGEDGLLDLAVKSMATSVLDVAKQAARYIEKVRDPSSEMVKKIMLWLIANEQQAATKAAMREEISPVLLRYAIESGERLSQKMKRKNGES